MNTNTVSAKDIKRNWHLIDATDQVLGRIATAVAVKLRGKQKSNFVPYLDMGDYVVVTNAAKVKITGKKNEQKRYVRHSGYPGGLKVETFDKLIQRRPEEIVRHAVWGMMPKGKLGRKMIKKLHIFADNKHPFEKQLGGKSQ